MKLYIATIFIPLSPDTGFLLPLDGGSLPEHLRSACSPPSPWFGKKNLSFYLVKNSCTSMTGIVKSWVPCSAFTLPVSLQQLRVAIKTNMAVLSLRRRGYNTQNCIVSAQKDANTLISLLCKEKKKEKKTTPPNTTIVTFKTTVWTQNIHVELFGYNIISQTVLSVLSYQDTHKWNSFQAKSLQWFDSSTRADFIWEVGCFL